jgi:hypothetical protein
MSMAENLARWISASVHKYVLNNKGEYKLFLDGYVRTEEYKVMDLFELKIDGPLVYQYGINDFKAYVEVSILVSTIRDPIDFHKPQRMYGKAQSILLNDICVYKYGDGPEDDKSLLGTLQIKSDYAQDGVSINNFGQIEPDLPLIQGSVEAHYEMCYP